MKKILFAACMLLLSLTGFTQNYDLKTGDEIKIRKLSTDLDIVASDNTGHYFAEQRWFFNLQARLYKFDKNYTDIYEKDYRKELRGSLFRGFQPIDDELFMFSTEYTKKEKTFTLYARKINKANGEIKQDPKEIGTFPLEKKRDDFEVKFTPVTNGKKLLFVANVSNDDRVSLVAAVLDPLLKREATATIDFHFTPNQFSVQDVFYTNNDKIIVLGKESEETQVGKRKKKRWVFKQYVLHIFSKEGKKENEIPITSDQRFAISGKLIEQTDGTVALAGFYSNDPKKKDLNGFFFSKIDTEKNQLVLSSFKEINSSMIGQQYSEDEGDDDDEDKKSKKEEKKNDEDEEDELPNDYVLKSVLINPADNSLVITAEISQLYIYRTQRTNGNMITYNTVYSYTTKDVLLIALNNEGKVKWINTIPKKQQEKYSDPNISRNTSREDYFSGKSAHPYYSSFASFINKDKLIILLNDHVSNNTNAAYGHKVKRVYNFKKKSNLYGISIDLSTGNMKRKFIHENSSGGIMMPRSAYINGTTILIPALHMKMLGKNEIKMCQLTIK